MRASVVSCRQHLMGKTKGQATIPHARGKFSSYQVQPSLFDWQCFELFTKDARRYYKYWKSGSNKGWGGRGGAAHNFVSCVASGRKLASCNNTWNLSTELQPSQSCAGLYDTDSKARSILLTALFETFFPCIPVREERGFFMTMSEKQSNLGKWVSVFSCRPWLIHSWEYFPLPSEEKIQSEVDCRVVVRLGHICKVNGIFRFILFRRAFLEPCIWCTS